MDIVVCIKQVLDVHGALRYSPRMKRLESKGVPYIISPFDELALEYALQLKERYGGEVTSICLGKSTARESLQYCRAAGSDRCLLISEPTSYELDFYATGKIIAKAIQSLKYDLILCGLRAVDDNAGVVGAVIAECLALPLITGTVAIEGLADTSPARLLVHRKAGSGEREVLETVLPAVLTVEFGSPLRYPTVRSRITASKAGVESCDLLDLGLSADTAAQESRIRLVRLSSPKPKLKTLLTPDASLSPADRIGFLTSGGMAKKAGNRLEGEPKVIASKLVQTLADQNLIRVREAKLR